MDAKLEKIIIKNFGKIEHIEVEIKGKVTRLIGLNGAGKTTVGYTAIVAAFKGIVEKGNQGQIIGNRYLFIGPKGTSSDVIVHIRDVKNNALIEVSNHITASKNGITFKIIESESNYVLNESWLTNLFNESLLSASKFTSLSAKEQALALGVDTTEIDKKIAEVKSEYTILNREVKSFGELKECKPIEKLNGQELYDELMKANEHNQSINKYLGDIETKIQNIDYQRDKIRELEEKIEEINKLIISDYRFISNLQSKIKPAIPTEPIKQKIAKIEENNAEYQSYVDYTKKLKEKQAVEAKVTANRTLLEQHEQSRLELIKSKKLPFKNLSIDDDGGLLMNGRFIRPPFFSTGELEKIVAFIAKAQNPNLKLRFIDDFNLVDEINQELILKELTDAGFDVIVADVGNESKENGILIRDGKIVK